MKSLTPILIVEEIEPCVKFWKDRLGFEVTAEVPEGDKLGFVMLAKDGVQLMYQTRESVKKDVGTAVDKLESCNPLYFIVEDIDAVERAMDGIQKVMPRRETFYGATEFSVREPGGYVMCFSQHSD